MNHIGDIRYEDRSGFRFSVLDVQPKQHPIEIPDYLPDRVAKTFKEACEIVKQSPAGACAMFRKALEIGLKDLSQDIEAWKLEKRIDKMAAENRITPAIQEWAHQLRLDGNEAVHEAEDPTVDDAIEMQNLTRFVLTYVFSLPGQVAAAQENRNH